jgi:hypothetical protein
MTKTTGKVWLVLPLCTFITAGCADGRTVYNDRYDAGSDAGTDSPTDAPIDFGDAGTGTGDDEDDAGPTCKPTCIGECLPSNPLGSDEGVPAVLLVGPDEQHVGSCPPFAPAPLCQGRGLFSVGESTCPSCACGASVGTCALSSSIAAHAGICWADAPATPTNAPPQWDGACTNANPIKPGVTCAGALCVQSVTVGEMVKLEESCTPEPSNEAPVFPAPTWGMFGRACGYDQGACDTAHVCVPEPVHEPACLAWSGERECPAEKFTERFVLYSGIQDTRACSSCACGAPEGSACDSLVKLFKDGACGEPIGTVGAGSNGAACVDLKNPPGLAIGSKSATSPLYHAGTCAASGGTLEGAAEPTGAMTFCCFFPAAPH